MTIKKHSKHAKLQRPTQSNEVPRINGLVLSGGKSSRMGRDKGQLDYHGVPQKEYVTTLLCPLCQNTFISVAQLPDNEKDPDSLNLLPDTFLELGPYGGILSAFRHDPNVAWLIVACDIPFIDQSSLEKLLSNRDPSKLATCFHNPETAFPEPLITIWEPRAYPVLLEYLSLGYSCPRKVLINSDIRQIDANRQEVLMNVNTPEDFERVKSLIDD